MSTATATELTEEVTDAPARRVGDLLFASALAAYTVLALGAIVVGVLAAIAIPAGLHDGFHVTGMRADLTGRVAEAIADAAHQGFGPGLVVDYTFTAANLALAGFLLWLRPRNRTARLLAVALIGTATIFNLQAFSVYESLSPTPLVLEIVHVGFHVVAAACYAAALLLFPDGWLIPRWDRSRLVALYVPAGALLVWLALRIQGTSRTLAVILVFGLLTPIVGVAAQAYRYRTAPSPPERQQARTLFWALLPALLLGLYVLQQGLAREAFTVYEGRPITVIPTGLFRVFQPVFAIIPLALVAGIVRFRLWNIERVITRALMSGALIAFVTLVYVGVVVLLGRLVGTRGDSLVPSIVATGVVAVAFEPVKERLNRLVNRLVYGRRASPYEALAGFTERMGESLATEEKLSRLARTIAEGTAATRSDVWLAVAGELRPAASWPEHSAELDTVELPADGTLPALSGVSETVPVEHQGELLGALSLTLPPGESLGQTEDRLVRNLAAQAGLVLRNVRLTAELLDRLRDLRASRQRLVAAQDEARRRLERNLHDGAQQQLVALKVKLSLAERLIADGKDASPLLHQLGIEAGEAIDTLRDLARGIYPPLLAEQGLEAALRAQANKATLPIEVTSAGVGRYSQDVEAAVYFCCLEAMQNIAKYAAASSARIALEADDSGLSFEVVDDGAGFDPDAVQLGAGLQNMVDRLDALDGRVEVRSRPGEGCTLSGWVPAEPREVRIAV